MHEDRNPEWTPKDGGRVEKILKGLEQCYSLKGEYGKVRTGKADKRQGLKVAGRYRQSHKGWHAKYRAHPFG